jgi:hypothetical protein
MATFGTFFLITDKVYFIPQVADIKPPQPMDAANPGMLYDLIG